jgi:hypothetical protein
MTKAEKGKFAVTKKGQTAQDFTYDNEGKLVSKDQKTGTDWAESVKEVSGLMKDPRNFTGTLVSSNLQQFQNYYIVNCNYLKRISNREPVNAEKVNEKLSIIRDVQEKLISMNIIPDDAATRKYKSVLQRQKEESKPLLKADHSSVVSSASRAPSGSGTASVVSSASRAPSASGTASVISSASRAPSAPPSGSVVSKAHASGASSASKAPSAPSSVSESASAVSRAPSKAPSGSVVSKAHASSASKAPSAPPSAFESASAVSKPRGLPSKAPSGYASGASSASRAPSKAPSGSGASRAPSKAPAPESRVKSVSTIPKSIGTDVQSISNFKSSQKKFQSEYAKAPFAVSEYVDNWYAADSSIA